MRLGKRQKETLAAIEKCNRFPNPAGVDIGLLSIIVGVSLYQMTRICISLIGHGLVSVDEDGDLWVRYAG